MRKTIPVLLVLSMIFSAFAVVDGPVGTASAAGSEDFDYVVEREYDWWTGESTDTVTITGYHGPGGDVVIPSVIDSLPVTTIAENAFYCCDSMTSVIVPDSVTEIGYGAFYNCRSLTTATTGNGATLLDGTFILCYALQYVTIGNNVTTIGENAFGYCFGLASVTIPASVTTIEKYSFQYCFDLGSMTFKGNAPVLERNWDYQRTAISSSAPLTAYFYYGASGFSLPSWNGIPSVKLPIAPSEPRDLMIRSGDGNATLFWEAPASNGGAAIDHYVVYMNGTELITSVNRTVTIDGLTNGVEYNITVAAHNAAGIGKNSSEELAFPSGQRLTVPPPSNDDLSSEKAGTGSPIEANGIISAEQAETNRSVFMGAFGLIAVAAAIAGFVVARQGAAAHHGGHEHGKGSEHKHHKE